MSEFMNSWLFGMMCAFGGGAVTAFALHANVLGWTGAFLSTACLVMEAIIWNERKKDQENGMDPGQKP